MLLAGDIGGTKTLLGLFEPAPDRPRAIAVRSYGSIDFAGLPAMLSAFLAEQEIAGRTIDTACVGVAGPVIDQAAEITNVPWRVDGREVAAAFGLRRVTLLNDLEAMAHAVHVLSGSELHVLQTGTPRPGGNAALIAAGTGLGVALLHNVGGRLVPSPSEGGHADFAARTEREIALVRDITRRHGRSDVESVVSGRGLVNIHRFAHAAPCVAGVDLTQPDAQARMTTAALEKRCDGCVETLDLFVEAYGAETGNLALRCVATGGVFVGGGIAPKILPALTTGAFMRAFNAKPPLDGLLKAMPVNVILNAEAGLLGAAVFASAQR